MANSPLLLGPPGGIWSGYTGGVEWRRQMSPPLPTISVVTPSFNQGRFIAATLRSVLSQTHPPAEYFVMDGGSTDQTVDVLKTFSHSLHWVSEKDNGQADAIDRGFRKSTGDILAWLNSDDRYAHDRVLQRVAELFAANPDADVLYADGQFVDTDGKPFRLSRGNPVQHPKDLLILPAGFALQPSVFFRRSLYLDSGGIDPRFFGAFDYDLWLRLFAIARRVLYVPEVWSHATCHPDAKSIHAMPRLIRELTQIKRQNAPKVGLNVAEMVKMKVNIWGLWAYYAAVRTGLRRAV